MRKKCDEYFGKDDSLDNFNLNMAFSGWLYDCNVVHTPTVYSRSSQGRDFDFDDQESISSSDDSPQTIITKALRETGFPDRVWTTLSFSKLQSHSQMNFLRGMDKIIQHIIKVFAPQDFKDVHAALNERWNKKMKEKIEKKYG